MASIPIALQLFSVRRECAEDLPGTLEAVARMGYQGVEFAGYHNRQAQELKGMLDDLGLAVAGTHIGMDTLLGDQLRQTIEFNQELGNRFLIVPYLKRDTKEDWKRAADEFTRIAEKLRPVGMRTGYHNHSHDFSPLDGTTPWDVLFSNASRDVIMQVDTGNAFHGGANPVPFLERYPGRAASVHLKEYSATNDRALIGEGDVPWKKVFALCEGMGKTEWYIVEQESYAYPPLECVAKCLDNLRRMGK